MAEGLEEAPSEEADSYCSLEEWAWKPKLELREDAAGRVELCKEPFHQPELDSSRWECMTRVLDACIPWSIQVLISLLKKSNSFLNPPANWILLLGTCSCQDDQ